MPKLPARPPARLFATGDFPELAALETLIRRADGRLRSEIVCEVTHRGERLPIHCVELGTTSPDAPAVGFFGGIHGVEEIGSQVVLAFLHTLVERLHLGREPGATAAARAAGIHAAGCAAMSHTRWRPPPEARQALFESALAYWYHPERHPAGEKTIA